jgi:hypothetical protein
MTVKVLTYGNIAVDSAKRYGWSINASDRTVMSSISLNTVYKGGPKVWAYRDARVWFTPLPTYF